MGFTSSRACRWMLIGLLAGAFVSPFLCAEPGDADNSHDYPGFPRLPGYLISDYDEDNPAQFTFSVSRPLSVDLDHVENMVVKGHRYVIRYELGPGGQAQTLLQTQKAYEKMAADGGYTLEKTGAVGDVTETFHRTKNGRETWVSLTPGGSFHILTVVESSLRAPGTVSKPAPMPIMPLVTAITAPPGPVAKTLPTALPPAKPTISAPPVLPTEDPFYGTLLKEGRVVLPLTFLPGKPDLDADSQPVIDRVAAMLRRHPDVQLEIEGHTDNSGSEETNQRLSEQRAVAVRGMLVAEKIDRHRLVAVGLGGSVPLAKENTIAGREKNRRIELVLRKHEESTEPAQKDPAEAKVPVKSVHQEKAQHKTVPDDSMVLEDDSPKGPAPNGTNYYPAASGGK